MLTATGLPSGPLGWVATRQMAVEHRPSYATMARELDLQPDDDLLDVGCGSAGSCSAMPTRPVRRRPGPEASSPSASPSRTPASWAQPSSSRRTRRARSWPSGCIGRSTRSSAADWQRAWCQLFQRTESASGSPDSTGRAASSPALAPGPARGHRGLGGSPLRGATHRVAGEAATRTQPAPGSAPGVRGPFCATTPRVGLDSARVRAHGSPSAPRPPLTVRRKSRA